MNKQRRKELGAIYSELEQIRDRLETCAGEERDYYDNMPESLQQGEKGEKADEVASQLADAAQYIEDACAHIEEAKS